MQATTDQMENQVITPVSSEVPSSFPDTGASRRLFTDPAAMWLTLIVCLSTILPPVAVAQPYGLDTRTSIEPFLDHRLPPTAPDAATGWSVVPAFPNLKFRDPTFLVAVPRSDRLCVGSLWGVIYHFVNDPAVTSKTVLLDLSAHTKASMEGSGLLNLAFHPEFGQAGSPNRGYLYVYYEYSPDPADNGSPFYNRLSRFTVSDGATVADPASELVLIDQFDPHLWHNGGALFFGADGFLYLSNGDGGGANDSFNNSQRLDFGLFSGLLRLDVNQDPAKSHPIRRHPQSADPAYPSFSGNYSIPNDNPFLDPGGGKLEEFWALGLRSPHRATFDPPTGQIWEGDVGETEAEEINLIEKGGNYQWAYKEGFADGPKPRPNPVLGTEQPPLHTYPHLDGNADIIGGYVYRGAQFADLLDGKYIFGDNGSGRIWALTYGGGNPTSAVEIGSVPPWRLSTFGLDRNSEIYLCELGADGGIYKLARAPESGPAPPALLSQTGVFSDLAALTPAPGLVPYGVNTPLWSDGAAKHRWIAVPNDTGQTVAFSPTGEWAFPNGTVFVKHFELPVDENNPAVTKRLETRLLVRDANGTAYGLTYKWRDDNSDADLLSGSLTEDVAIRTAAGGTRTQTWYYPSRQACLACHTANAGHVLGVNTRQLNGDFTYPGSGVTDNQLRTWHHLGLLSPALNEGTISSYDRLAAIDDPTASLELRVRSYVDANCAQCHRPGGGARAYFDARFDTPLSLQGIINGLVGNPLGVAGAHVVTPQSPDQSAMYLRLVSTASIRMPPLARNTVDDTAAGLFADWINHLAAAEPLPAPWVQQDVGAVGLAGDVSYSGGGFAVSGSGSDIWDKADSFHFVYQPWSGDGEIVAQVTNLRNTDSWAKAGVMFRESLDAGARHATALITPVNGTGFQRRLAAGGASSFTAGSYSPPPRWLKLTRQGPTFTAYASADGSTWTLIGADTLDLPGQLYVGLAVTAHANSTLTSATFANVWVGPIDDTAPGVSLVSPPAGATLSGRVALNATASDDSGVAGVQFLLDGANLGAEITVPPFTLGWTTTTVADGMHTLAALAHDAAGNCAISAPVTVTVGNDPAAAGGWQSADIGSGGAPGGASRSGDTFALTGAGGDIWGPTDAFHFHAKTLTGDGAIFAEVTALDDTDPWAKAGLMFRESLAPDARNVMIFATPQNHAGLQYRLSAGGDTASTSAGYTWLPLWLTLSRTGNIFSGYYSQDGANWTPAGSIALDLPATLFVGPAVTSHRTGTTAAATFSGLGFDVDSGPTTGDWSQSDIGNVGLAGSGDVTANTITVRGAGTDIWDTADSFRFVYQPWHGDGQIIARVASLDDTHPWAKAGVMFRETLAPDAPNALVCVTPHNGAGFQARSDAGGTTDSVGSLWGSDAPFWLKLLRRGDLFSAYGSDDGNTWRFIGSRTVVLGADLYVGFTVTAHTDSALATATFTDFTLKP